MTELRDALEQIREIRLRLAGAEVFTGYRAAPTALSGVLAILAGILQPVLAPDPIAGIGAYLALWTSVAILSGVAALVAMRLRPVRNPERLGRQTTRLALEHLLPSVLAGALLTFGLIRFAPDTLHLLPALWQILFSLGLFASCRILPRGMVAIAVWYLASGFLCLQFARGDHVLSPWAMALPFGAGQLLAAAVLYWTLERWDGRHA